MIEVALQPIPNQAFTIQLEKVVYAISIKYVINLMTVSIVRAGTLIISNIRAIPGRFIIPYSYLELGNFAIYTQNDEYPNYTQFGINQFLFYLSQSDLGDLIANN